MTHAQPAQPAQPPRAARVGSGDFVVAPNPYIAAFFDVDNTMMMGASIFHFAKGLAARDFFSGRDLIAFSVKQVRMRMRGETHGDLATTRESALAFVAGKKVDDLVSLGEEIYDEEMADRIWPGTFALARAHLSAGERVWLVTATPVELATIIAQRLELTGALGTIAESESGYFTGRLVGDVLHGEAKARAVLALAAREGLDLARCSAYSDSINDMPLLAAVGRPVVVNPDSALRAEAEQRGWEIHDYRSGRKAALIAIATAVGLGSAGGAVAAALAARRALQARRAAPERAVPAAQPRRFGRVSARRSVVAPVAAPRWTEWFPGRGR